MQIQDNPARLRYELIDHDGGRVAGFAAYRDVPGSRTFVHTEVDDAYAGQGLAGRLAKYAVEHVRDAGLRLVPECPYIAGWLKRHPEYDGIVDWPGESASAKAKAGQA